MKAKILKSTGISLIVLTALSIASLGTTANAQQPPARPKAQKPGQAQLTPQQLQQKRLQQQKKLRQQQQQRVQQPPAQPVQPTPVRPLEPESDFKFGVDFSTRYSFQPEVKEGETRRETISYELIPAIATEDYRFRGVFGFADNFKTPGSTEWENTAFEWRKNKPWDLGDYLQLQPELLAALPLFKRGSDFNGYAGGRVNVILNSKNIDIPGLIFKYGFQFGKLFHKAEYAGTEANPKYYIDMRIRQRVHLGYQITDQLLALSYFHLDSDFYFDNTLKNTFFHETFIEYAPVSFMTLALGITNGGGVYRGDNQEQDNVQFYDADSTDIFIGVGVSF